MPDQVKRFTVALKEHGASVVVLASDYEKALTQRDEELRERLEKLQLLGRPILDSIFSEEEG